METLELSTKKVTIKTIKEINEFIYANREKLSNEMKLFYNDIRSSIQYQLRKPKTQRLDMNQLLERVYNNEYYILQAGAISYEVVFA